MVLQTFMTKLKSPCCMYTRQMEKTLTTASALGHLWGTDLSASVGWLTLTGNGKH